MLVRPSAVTRRRGLALIGAAAVLGSTPRPVGPLGRAPGLTQCRVGGTCAGLEDLVRRRRARVSVDAAAGGARSEGEQ
jgi:hypothetical protein